MFKCLNYKNKRLFIIEKKYCALMLKAKFWKRIQRLRRKRFILKAKIGKL